MKATSAGITKFLKADSNHINRFPKTAGVDDFFSDYFIRFLAAFKTHHYGY